MVKPPTMPAGHIGDRYLLHWPDGSREEVGLCATLAPTDTRAHVIRIEMHAIGYIDDFDRSPDVPRAWLRPIKNT